ncbi:MAG: GldG family protein [Spirochaetales bacterium]|nr:GldG family protein [Spirochaetales bacterium]
MTKRMQEIIISGLVLLVILFIGFNSAVYFFRLDITENKMFTITDVSKNLFQDIPEQVHITYYVSEKIKNLHPLPLQIEDMLNEYAAYSKGKITLTVKYPIKQKLENETQALNIYPISFPVQEQGEYREIQVYMGVAIQYLDKYVVIPFINQIETLEYELTSSIRNLVKNKEKVVGILLGRSDLTFQHYQALVEKFSPTFKVEQVARGEDIPENISVLFVLGNADLNEFDLFPIDQYIMRGGKVLFAVEGVNVNLQYMVGFKLENQPLLNMLARYGVVVKPELVVDNLPVPIRDRLGIIMQRYPYWVVAHNDFVSKTNPITSKFGGAVFYWASPLELKLPDDVEGELIVNSTDQSAVIKDQFNIRPDQVMVQYEMAKKDSMQSYGLVAVVNGSFPSYFSDKDIPFRKGEDRKWEDKETKSIHTRLVVVGDADIGAALFDTTNLYSNIVLLTNCAEWLSNDDDLLQIKNRSAQSMDLYKIQDKEKRANAAGIIYVLNQFFVPLLVIGIGVWRYFSRKKKQKLYEQGSV